MSLSRVRLRLGRLELEAELAVGTGELVVLLGPNGAGKTTLLRALAGLLALERGRVVLDGVAGGHRGRFPGADRAAAGRVRVPGLPAVPAPVGAGERRLRAARPRPGPGRGPPPGGGLVGAGSAWPATPGPGPGPVGGYRRSGWRWPGPWWEPRLLLDEPLAALDAATRTEVRRDLRRHLASFDGTRLLVTHDLLEAMALADRLVVLEGGHVTQRPAARPRSASAPAPGTWPSWSGSTPTGAAPTGPRSSWPAGPAGRRRRRHRGARGLPPSTPTRSPCTAAHPRAPPATSSAAPPIPLHVVGDRVRVRVAGLA